MLGIVLLFALFPVLPRDVAIAAGGAIALLAAVGWRRRWMLVPELGAFSAACITLALLGLPSQFVFALGLGVYGFAVAIRRSHSKSLTWLAVGAVTREVGLLAGASVLLSAIALALWFLTVRPDINDIVRTYVPDWSLAALLFGGLLFSMVNAAVEEAAYRGIVMNALDTACGAGALSLVGQAAAFGILHIHGFPRGWSGVALAFVFGMLMGLIRRRSGGLLAPWVTHVCADIVIVGIVVLFARK